MGEGSRAFCAQSYSKAPGVAGQDHEIGEGSVAMPAEGAVREAFLAVQVWLVF
jgi:hypothetical protein